MQNTKNLLTLSWSEGTSVSPLNTRGKQDSKKQYTMTLDPGFKLRRLTYKVPSYSTLLSFLCSPPTPPPPHPPDILGLPRSLSSAHGQGTCPLRKGTFPHVPFPGHFIPPPCLGAALEPVSSRNCSTAEASISSACLPRGMSPFLLPLLFHLLRLLETSFQPVDSP